MEQKRGGRVLILATASDIAMANPVARHVGLFDGVMASDGKTNLRHAAKLHALTEKFGPRGFDYAGNSSVDLGVWAFNPGETGLIRAGEGFTIALSDRGIKSPA